jgi:hypothetical protein
MIQVLNVIKEQNFNLLLKGQTIVPLNKKNNIQRNDDA